MSGLHAEYDITAPAYAKLNLMLKIVGRRNDGYHLLYTLFHRISLCDRLFMRHLSTSGINLIVPQDIPDGHENIVYRSAEMFMSRSAVTTGVEIRIEKNIPAGGGLGGGSSDAAVALNMLNRLAENPLPYKALYEMASALGADVPFFLTGHGSAVGRGTGSELAPVDFPRLIFLLIFPDFGVSTAWAYTHCSICTNFHDEQKDNMFHSSYLWQNDLEEPVFGHYPVLAKVKASLLKNGAQAAMMSGSGSTMFGVFETIEQAKKCASRISLPDSWQCHIAESV